MPHALPASEILAHLIDVHCHPTDAPSIAASTIESLPCTLCAMSTQEGDQSKVASLARARPDRVVPAFGYHPWWAHRISLSAPVPDHAAHYRALFLSSSSSPSSPSPPPSAELETAFARLLPTLPPPISLADVLADVRTHLTEFPTAMLGEVGFDRAARIPFAGANASDGGSGQTLSPFSTPFAHQLAILEAQLALAVELRRNVSLHSVKASGQTRALFDRMAATHGAAWFAISVDVHSCTLSPEVWRDIEVRPFLLRIPHSPTPEARGGMSADGWNRNITQMCICHSRRLSMAVRRVTLHLSVHVRPLGFLSSRITMMRVMHRGARGTWHVKWRRRTGGQSRTRGRIVQTSRSGALSGGLRRIGVHFSRVAISRR
jgi:Tat protein secretion system quality control protein TatD with DNase activity